MGTLGGGVVMSDLLYLQSPSQKSEIFASPLYTRGPLTRFAYPLHKGALALSVACGDSSPKGGAFSLSLWERWRERSE